MFGDSGFQYAADALRWIDGAQNGKTWHSHLVRYLNLRIQGEPETLISELLDCGALSVTGFKPVPDSAYGKVGGMKIRHAPDLEYTVASNGVSILWYSFGDCFETDAREPRELSG